MALAELLGFIPVEKLKVYLDPENNWQLTSS
jgi:hypothetical protein